MLLVSCSLAVAVLAALSTLILLLSRFEKPCSGNYRPRAVILRDISEAEMPVDSDGLHTLAAAFCCVAAGAHSKDPANQEQLAAILYELCCTGFEGVRVDPAVKAFVEGMKLSAKKANKS